LSKFYVFCETGTLSGNALTESSTYFDEELVSIDAGNYVTEHKPWLTETTFRFAAYSDGNNESPITDDAQAGNPKVIFDGDDANNNNKWSLTFKDYVVSPNKDLIVAFPDQITTGTDVSNMTTVNVHFQHALSKVEFMFNTTIEAGTKMYVYPFGFTANKKGTGVCYSDKNYEWNDQSDEGMYKYVHNSLDYDSFNSTVSTNTNGKLVSDNVESLGTPVELTGTRSTFQSLVLPQSNQELKIPYLVIETRDNSDRVLDTKIYKDIPLKLVDTNSDPVEWKANTLYSYQATLGTDAHDIHFYAEVRAFDDPTIGDSGIMGN